MNAHNITAMVTTAARSALAITVIFLFTARTTLAEMTETKDTNSQVSKGAADKKNPLAAVQAKYKNARTLTAEFTQRQKNAALGTTKESAGRIYFKRPNQFRWETHTPELSILVGNGKKVWYYTAPFRPGEKGQVLVKKAADVQSRLAIDLLAGTSNTEKDFKIKTMGENHLRLVPIKSAGDIEAIELFVEKLTNLVYKLVLFTKSGNETALLLRNVTLGPNLSDKRMFDFEPPPNTEEIQ